MTFDFREASNDFVELDAARVVVPSASPALSRHVLNAAVTMIYITLALALLAASARGHSLRVPAEHLFPAAMSPRTRAAHRAALASWRAPVRAGAASPVVFPTDFGADPTGVADSSPAFARALAAVLARATGRNMSDGIADLGGVVLDLQGGEYALSAPLAIPQFVGNLRVIDGTLRASAAFPPSRFVLEVGARACTTPSGQGSCNENVGLSGLTLDGAHVAAGCLMIDASSAVFGFVETGILLAGGHETMISETWVAAYFWSDPKKERNDATGIAIAGNDHFVSNVIVFSARVGVDISGAANKLTNVHTWNCATGNGGIGILNRESQNIFIGVYMDFTDLVLRNAQQISVTNGFFLGGAQLVFEAQKANDTVLGVSLLSNVWYDCDGPSLAVNETLGAWTSVVDLDVVGTAFCGYARTKATGLAAATKVVTAGGAVDFSDVLLFPHAGIASARYTGYSAADPCFAFGIGELPRAGEPLRVTANLGCAASRMELSVDQSARSSTSAA